MTCGKGLMVRNRTCLAQPCEGHSIEAKDCYQAHCPQSKISLEYFGLVRFGVVGLGPKAMRANHVPPTLEADSKKIMLWHFKDRS